MPANPYSREAEMCLIGCMVLDNDLIPKIAAKVPEEAFYVEANKEIFRAALGAYKETKKLDLVLLSDRLGNRQKEVGGAEYLIAIVEGLPHSANWLAYTTTVLDRFRLREAISAAGEITEVAEAGGTLEEIYKIADKIKSRTNQEGHIRFDRCLLDTIASVGRTREEGVDLKTGFHSIDQCLGGLRRGTLTVVGGKTSQGKTSVCVNIARYNLVGSETTKILYNGFENLDQFATRLAAIEHGVPLDWFLKPNLISKEQFDQMVKALQDLDKWKDRILIMNSASVLQMRAMCDEFKPDIIFIDFIQRYAHRYNLGQEGRLSHEIGKVVSDFQDLALDKKASVVAFSQFGRRTEEHRDREPVINDLKESGDIENYADNILLLWWPWRDTLKDNRVPEDYNITVAKNKLGRVDRFNFKIDLPTLKISNWIGANK